MRNRKTTAFLAVTGLMALLVRGDLTTSTILRADQTSLLQDTDGDLLPDVLEWASLTNPFRTDTNGDGNDDFFDVANYRVNALAELDSDGSPDNNDAPVPPYSARVLVSTSRGPGPTHVLLNILFAFGPNQAPSVQLLYPFIDVRGVQVPIESIMTSSLIQVAARNQRSVGSYFLVTARLCSLEQLRPLLPCTLAALVVIDGSPQLVGTQVMDVNGIPAAIVPVGEDQLAFHAILPPQEVQNPFWVDNKACVFQLVQVGATQTSILCEITGANCKGAATMCCDPGGCRSKEGGMVSLPAGMRSLKGG